LKADEFCVLDKKAYPGGLKPILWLSFNVQAEEGAEKVALKRKASLGG
jgi:hypothetical protein